MRNSSDNFYLSIKNNVDSTKFNYGELLHNSWQLKKTLSNKISTKLIDLAYDKAIDCGAIGGKICGAGGGGFLMLIAEPKFHSKIESEMINIGLNRYKINFINEGCSVFEIS